MRFIILLVTFPFVSLFSEVFHHVLIPCPLNTYVWSQNETRAFDEFILSWNAFRPQRGFLRFWVSVKVDEEWLPWIPYADWGKEKQCTFEPPLEGGFHTSHGVVKLPHEVQGDGFRVRVSAEGGATLNELKALHISLAPPSFQACTPHFNAPLFLPVIGKCNSAFRVARADDLSSPASAYAVVHYLSKKPLNCRRFALLCYDSQGDNFNNFSLSTAQSFDSLEGSYYCYAEKLSSFCDLLTSLEKGIPTVVAIKTDLIHPLQLAVVTGYDPRFEIVYCINPAVSSDEETQCLYPLKEFLIYWERGDHMSYCFKLND